MTGHETEAIPTLPALKGLGRLADVRPALPHTPQDQLAQLRAEDTARGTQANGSA